MTKPDAKKKERRRCFVVVGRIAMCQKPM